MRHDSDSIANLAYAHARKTKIGCPKGNRSRSYCSSIITMQIKKSDRLSVTRALALANVFSAQIRPKLVLSGVFATFHYMQAKTPIKRRVISCEPSSPQNNPNLFIYNNIKTTYCQALQSLQTLTFMPCEQKENLHFLHPHAASEMPFWQVVGRHAKHRFESKFNLPQTACISGVLMLFMIIFVDSAT